MRERWAYMLLPLIFFDNCDIFEDPYAASQSMTLPHGHDAQMVQGVFDDFAN